MGRDVSDAMRPCLWLRNSVRMPRTSLGSQNTLQASFFLHPLLTSEVLGQVAWTEAWQCQALLIPGLKGGEQSVPARRTPEEGTVRSQVGPSPISTVFELCGSRQTRESVRAGAEHAGYTGDC